VRRCSVVWARVFMAGVAVSDSPRCQRLRSLGRSRRRLARGSSIGLLKADQPGKLRPESFGAPAISLLEGSAQDVVVGFLQQFGRSHLRLVTLGLQSAEKSVKKLGRYSHRVRLEQLPEVGCAGQYQPHLPHHPVIVDCGGPRAVVGRSFPTATPARRQRLEVDGPGSYGAPTLLSR